MVSYDDWNSALLNYVLEGAPAGAGIFLSTDDDTVAVVGSERFGLPLDRAVDDFCLAVRLRTVLEGRRVATALVSGRTEQGVPRGVGFLAATVLAASRMADAEDVSQINFFTRLREVLGFPLEAGRPQGMEGGAEEAIWSEWNRFLQEQGFLPTARRGEDEPRKFIAYPISQTLLRRADRDRLRRLFADERWVADWDIDTLFGRVRQHASVLTHHLREGVLRGSSPRLVAFADATHEVYEAWRQDPDPEAGMTASRQSLHLLAGLLRVEDAIMGNVAYYLYPRGPIHRRLDRVEVELDGGVRVLATERPGWFEPLGPVGPNELTHGTRCVVRHPVSLRSLVLPQREFWVLRPDPENPESGVLATWGRPPLGTPFTVLCQEHLVPQLEHLRNERLIELGAAPRPVFAADRWVEVPRCLVVSPSWSGVFVANRDLFDALRPIVSLDVSTSGGLRLPGSPGWIDGQGPRITVFGFEPMVDVRVVRVDDDWDVFSDSLPSNQPFSLDWDRPGDYRIEARAGGVAAERLVRIVGWDELRAAEPGCREEVVFGCWRLCGAQLTPQVGGVG